MAGTDKITGALWKTGKIKNMELVIKDENPMVQVRTKLEVAQYFCATSLPLKLDITKERMIWEQKQDNPTTERMGKKISGNIQHSRREVYTIRAKSKGKQMSDGSQGGIMMEVS